MRDFEVIVVGGGHAGCEAASVSARMGASTALITLTREALGRMSCNPAVGGMAKGQLVKEVDALGGEIGLLTDISALQFRMLGRSKGPAMWSPRAQVDRALYNHLMVERMGGIENLTIIEDEVQALEVYQGKISSVILKNSGEVSAKAVIIATGTFLEGEIFTGRKRSPAGRWGEEPSKGLSRQMKHLGFELMRLKTGTPPRISKRSVNFDALTPQRGDEDIHNFSLRTCPETLKREQLLCFQVFTNPDTHRLIREHLWEAPLYDGTIKGIGPRYCPSIETKVVNFPEKDRHLLFIEPEGWDHPWVYLNGFSTSLPEEVQIQALHTIAGLEEAEIARPGYAIEYDAFPPHQVKYTLESHLIEGLYLAGQIIGTSGYEEAAALGIMAGINAVLKIQGQPPFILDRSQAYIGVMIDDLIIRGAPEPYRMFTSRAEYRLLLRSDNADERLIGFSQKYGLLDNETVCKVQQKLYAVDELLNRLKITRLDFNGDNYSALELLKRPEIDINALFQIVLQFKNDGQFSAEEKRLVEIRVKYQGYIERQLEEVARYRKMESKFIPGNINYDAITSISYEGRERLKKVRPPSLGAASRLYGVTPADVAVLSVHLNKRMFPVEP